MSYLLANRLSTPWCAALLHRGYSRRDYLPYFVQGLIVAVAADPCAFRVCEAFIHDEYPFRCGVFVAGPLLLLVVAFGINRVSDFACHNFANPSLQATRGCACLFVVAQVPRAPEFYR